MTKNNAMPLLSVIVTVHGTEEWLPRCMDSVLDCTYPTLQLVIVDDKSPGNVKEIVDSYIERDARVKFVQHEINKGLYLARITGVENSDGEYIAFLDSDDHVSVDFYRRAMERALASGSDMVMGEFYREYNGEFSYNNLMHVRLLDIDSRGGEAAELLFNQRGKDYSLHVVWNKIYKRELWDACYPYLKLQDKHLIMCEDVLYSSLFFYFAKHVTNIHGDFVYYYKRKDSPTSGVKNYDICVQYVLDIIHVFTTLDDIFKNHIKDERYVPDLQQWKERLLRTWRKIVENARFAPWKAKKLLKIIDDAAGRKTSPDDAVEDDYFYAVITSQTELRGELLKRTVHDPAVEVVSFDVFDTLVCRPFWLPTDLFFLLGEKVDAMLDANDYVDFFYIRTEAEQRARKIAKTKSPAQEDITLDDIYNEIQRYLDIDEATTEKIKSAEIELEIHYCQPRAYAKEIFELAKALGKKVIITSDMYLPEDVIRQILSRAGYEGYDALFVSSSAKVTKATGNLYDAVCQTLKVAPKHILHIGDNFKSDVRMAQKKGWRAFHFPKAVDRFTNAVPNMYGGNSWRRTFESSIALSAGRQYRAFWGLRTLMAVAANKLFDNPYVEFNSDSDFNADPRIIGYYVLGMHMFALAQWLAQEVEKNRYAHFNFFARDGWLLMKAFEMVNPIYNERPAVDYLYLTRSVSLPLQIQKDTDLWSMAHNLYFHSQTPQTLFALFEPIIDESVWKNQRQFCHERGFAYDALFASLSDFYEFIRVFKNAFDWQKSKVYVDKIGEHLAKYFSGKTAIFDIGYSCRIESILKRTYGFDVTPYYMHIISDIVCRRAQRNDIQVHTFLEYTPGVVGVMRELLMSKLEASCKSLKFEGGSITPIFKEFHPTYVEQYIINIIQGHALQFVKDVTALFGENIKSLSYQRIDASRPFELLLAAPKMIDWQVFRFGDFEDAIGIGHENTIDLWSQQIKQVQQSELLLDWQLQKIPSKWGRAIYLFLIDRRRFKQKVKAKLRNNPRQMAFFRAIYKAGRKLYRLIR